MVKVHPKLFTVAVGGAAVFALLTVASSFAIGRVIDDVILPRFDDGEVATSTVLAGLGLVIGIGVVRARSRSSIRRSYASITMWRVAQTFTNRVVRRYVVQPVQLAQPTGRRRPGAARRRRRRGHRERARADPVRARAR